MASIFRKAVWAFVNHPAPEWVKLSGAVGLFVGLAVYSVSSELVDLQLMPCPSIQRAGHCAVSESWALSPQKNAPRRWGRASLTRKNHRPC